MRRIITGAPSPYVTLPVQYALMALYGALAGWQGTRTLDVVAGDLFGVIWPVLVLATSVAAIIGVLISRKRRNPWTEIVATLALILMLAAYGVTIIVRAIHDPQYDGLPFCVLPFALCVYPYARLWRIAGGDPA